MIEETWLPIKGYELLFEVSTHGRIRSLAKRSRKTVLHLLSGVYYDSAREAYNQSNGEIRFEVFCKNIRNNKNYTYGA